MDAYLVHHAAHAYGTDAALVTKVLQLAEPFPLPAAFVAASRFDGDPSTPEHNTYLVARWVASLKAAGLTDTALLDCMCSTAGVTWQRPLLYRLRQRITRWWNS